MKLKQKSLEHPLKAFKNKSFWDKRKHQRELMLQQERGNCHCTSNLPLNN